MIGLFALQLEALKVEKSLVPINFLAPFFITTKSSSFIICQPLFFCKTGPPSTKSKFENDVYIYIERKTSSSKLTKLGKKKLIANNVLILEIDNKGLLVSKQFFNKDDMKKIEFDDQITTVNFTKKSFIYNFLYSVRQKIDDPLGKKRAKN